MGELAIRLLDELDIRHRNLRIGSDGNCILIPLARSLVEPETHQLLGKLEEFDLTEALFAQRTRSPQTLVEALKGKLPPHSLACLPRAVDIIGDVAVIEIPKELEENRELVGEAIRRVNRNVHTVLMKAGPISTRARVREFEVIAGEGVTETTHHEYGLSFRLDLAKTYFSPRLSYEHNRVVSQVLEGEVVVDMFAGVGPFTIQVAANRQRIVVYAIDINPYAVRYLLQNIMINHVRGKVIGILGDSEFIIKSHLSAIANRVIMNLPGEASEFVGAACTALKHEGGMLHFYTFSNEPELSKETRDNFLAALAQAGRKLMSMETRLVRSTAPYQWQVAVDARIE